MNATIWRIFSTIFDMVAPPRDTEVRMREITLDDLQGLASGENALPYKEGVVTALVWELKYRANPRAAKLAGTFIAEELIAIAAEEIGKPLLIPVPMHSARRGERGYNQTELLCETALLHLPDSLEYAPDALVRMRSTPPQQGLSKNERLKNIQNSMEVKNPARISGRVCVVVDDVTTTGATFEECKRALKAAGARAVHCLALARS